MKFKLSSLLRFETLVYILIIVAFSLTWISWGKLVVTGWDVPTLYKKTTNISNSVLFFLRKDSPFLAYVIYTTPALGLLSTYFLLRTKYRTANFFLLLTCILGFATSLYMYYYLLSSKMLKLSNAGVGLHILCVVSFIGIVYSFIYCCRKRKKDTAISEDLPAENN